MQHSACLCIACPYISGLHEHTALFHHGFTPVTFICALGLAIRETEATTRETEVATREKEVAARMARERSNRLFWVVI
jgi:hypothetical protein